MCLPHITRKRDDPWWNGVLMGAKLPEGLKLILDHGVDPDVPVAERIYDAASPRVGRWLEHASNEETRHPGDDAARRRRVANDTRFAAQIDAARLGLPLGTHRACQTVPGTRR